MLQKDNAETPASISQYLQNKHEAMQPSRMTSQNLEENRECQIVDKIHDETYRVNVFNDVGENFPKDCSVRICGSIYTVPLRASALVTTTARSQISSLWFTPTLLLSKTASSFSRHQIFYVIHLVCLSYLLNCYSPSHIILCSSQNMTSEVRVLLLLSMSRLLLQQYSYCI